MRPASLSLILPALNEEENLEAALDRAVAALDRCGGEFEILVIDDGSTDSTAAIAEAYAAAEPRVRVLRNARNENYGVSLRRGIAAARCDWISHNGADLPLAPEDYPLFRAHFDEADVVVAARLTKEAHSAWRRVTSGVNHWLLRILFSPGSSDLNFTQFYRRTIFERISPVSTSPAFITPELILRAEHTGLRVVEVEAEFRRRPAGRAHFGKPKDILWTLRDMFRLRLLTWFQGWQQ